MDVFTGEIIGAATGAVVTIGGGSAWVADRLGKRQAALEARQDAERTRVEAERVRYELSIEQERIRHEQLVGEQVAELRAEISGQDREIGYLRRLSDAYLRHIAILEGLMRAKGIDIPAMNLPPAPSEG